MITEQPATDSNSQVMTGIIGGSVAVAVAVGVIIFAIIRYMFCLMNLNNNLPFSDLFLNSTESDVCHCRFSRMDIGGRTYTVDNHNVYLRERVTLISVYIVLDGVLCDN